MMTQNLTVHDSPLGQYSEVVAALEHIYTVFGRYRVGRTVVGCDCCVPKQMQDDLARTPLREQQSAELELYSSKAVYTWGSCSDFKYFLPRLCEHMLMPEGLALSPATIFERLPYCEWGKWREEEREAIKHFYAVVLAALVTCSPEPYPGDLDEWFEASQALEVEPLESLSTWLSAPLPTDAASSLVRYITAHGDQILGRASGVDQPDANREIFQWLKEHATQLCDNLYRSFDAGYAAGHESELQLAIDILELATPR